MESTQQAQTQPRSRDRWEQILDKKLILLKQCQQDHALKSCLACPELLACPVRDAYVKAVYESMSKGHGGGFEF